MSFQGHPMVRLTATDARCATAKTSGHRADVSSWRPQKKTTGKRLSGYNMYIASRTAELQSDSSVRSCGNVVLRGNRLIVYLALQTAAEQRRMPARLGSNRSCAFLFTCVECGCDGHSAAVAVIMTSMLADVTCTSEPAGAIRRAFQTRRSGLEVPQRR